MDKRFFVYRRPARASPDWEERKIEYELNCKEAEEELKKALQERIQEYTEGVQKL